MRVVAMLAWWDEPPDELTACITSLPTICDAVIAIDGAYEMTPGATAASPDEQAEAIKTAAAAAGIEASVVVPDTVWVGQVEKRDFMLRQAAADADWLIAVDADHRLIGNRDKIRAELAGLRRVDSIRHDFHTPAPRLPGQLKRLAPHSWHRNLSGTTIEHSLLFRRLDEMRVERVHWGYSGVTGGRRVSVGNYRADKIPAGRSHRLKAPFRVEHVCFERDLMRLDRNRDYCVVRDRFKNEHGFEP